MDLVVFRRSRSPSPIKKTGSSSRELRSPSETLQLSPAHRARRAPSMGSRTSSRCQQPESTIDRVPTPDLDVPPSTFLTPSTVSSSSRLASLFHPATTSRFSLQGFPPANQLAPTRRLRVPPRRWHRAPATAFAATPAPGASTSRSLLVSDPQWSAKVLVPRRYPCPLLRLGSFGLPCLQP
jgi:hypothetical protein